VDRKLVIGSSFNHTFSAQSRNGENASGTPAQVSTFTQKVGVSAGLMSRVSFRHHHRCASIGNLFIEDAPR
jgi:hypothetical protein